MVALKRMGCLVLVSVSLLVVAPNASAADNPLTEKALSALLDAQIDDGVILAKIQKSGLAFEVNNEVLQRLKSAGASEQVLDALRRATQSKPAEGAAKAVTYQQILNLLEAGLDEDAILKRLEKSPTIYTLDAQQAGELKKAGASEKLLAAMAGRRAAPPQSGDITDFAIILDCSGSMQEQTKDGRAKMTTAKTVVTDLVQKIPNGLNVTFIVYGHEVFGGANDPRNCQAVKVARPLSSLNESGKSELGSFIVSLQPRGATPIALALRTAGQELAKNNALCGMVLITDGLETCNGDPVGEAAALAQNLKLTFGVNVVGFDVKPQESEALQKIATAGKGKYYNAASAAELENAFDALHKELAVVAKPAEVVDTSRRALKFLSPSIEMPPMEEIYFVEAGQNVDFAINKVGSIAKYGEYLGIPSGTKKYDVYWKPKQGQVICVFRAFSLPERKVMDVRLETLVGFIQVEGEGQTKGVFVVPAGANVDFAIHAVQRAEKFGEVMVVPVGTYDLYVTNAEGKRTLVEEGLKVEAGKVQRLR